MPNLEKLMMVDRSSFYYFWAFALFHHCWFQISPVHFKTDIAARPSP